ncbi:hypothetical protein MASR1M74_15560 [Lentimicrobium sp.]
MDNKSKQDRRDSSQVSSSDDYEVQYFKDKMGVSASEVKDAIKKLGTNNRDKLTAYFEKHKPS